MMTLVPAPMKDEIGHNLGLHHSGADTNQYADEIGQVRIIICYCPLYHINFYKLFSDGIFQFMG